MRPFVFILLFVLCLFPLTASGVVSGDGPGTVGTTDGTSELELWVKADDLALPAGAPVSAWNDASGNGRHLLQPATEKRPVLAPDAVNGRPVVRFTADFFASLALPSSGNQFTVAAVVLPARTGAYQNILDDESSTRPMLWVDGLGNYEFNFTSGAVAPSTGGMDVVVAVKSSAAAPYSRLYLNGPAIAASGGTSFTIASSKTYDFFNRDEGQAFTGDVAELIIYSTALSAAEVAKLGWYLQQKYGLPGTFLPPFPTLSRYSADPAQYTLHVPVEPNQPVVLGANGATPSQFTIQPALPPGLHLDPLSGVITGTPDAVSPSAEYTVTASFPGHPDTSTRLRLAVANPSLAGYSSDQVLLTRGRPSTPLTPIVLGGPPTGFSITPALPAGLILDPATGIITGVPEVTTPATDYTVTAAFNALPASSVTLAIEIIAFSDTLDISEFVARNDRGLLDGLGRRPDWIELHNFGLVPIDLAGWSLTDSAGSPRKWVFPQKILPAGEYLVVFASGDGAPDPSGSLHANFSLAADGEFLALVQPDGTTVARAFSPAYPPQESDVSFGSPDRDRFGAYATPTPGTANGFFDISSARVTAAPAGRAFAGTLEVALTAPLAADAVIRYTLNGSPPTSASPAYTGPITLTANTRLRARVFEPELDPGPELGETYLKLGASMAAFSSNLPIVLLDTDAAIAAASATTLTGANTLIIAADPTTQRAAAAGAPDYAGRGGLRIRGRSSQSFPQKQFKFETWNSAGLETDARLLGIAPGSDWVLHAPYTDKSLMRNAMAYTMWGRMGWPSLATRFVEVFINDDGGAEFTYADDYAGVYMLVESITLDRLGLESPEPEAAPGGVTGGFIIETGPSDDQEFATTASGRTTGHKHRDPGREQLSPGQRTWIRDYYTTFEQALYGAGFRHPTSGRPYTDFTDAASQVDYRIAREWSRNFDGGSTYSHVPRGGKLTMGPLWDYNWAFGNVNYAEGGDIPGYRTDGWNRSFTGLPPWAPWCLRLEQDPDWWQQFIDRWATLREGILADDTIAVEIDALAARLGAEAAARHFSRWPQLGQFTAISPPGWQTRTTYQSEVDFLKTWLVQRSAWIDAQFPPRPTMAPAPGPVAAGTSVVISAGEGETIHYSTDGSDPRLAGGQVAAGARSLTSGQSVVIDSSAVLIARVQRGTVWGPPRQAGYVTGTPPAPDSLLVTELAFHPADPTPSEKAALPDVTADDFEFLELYNADVAPLDLTGARFTEGINFLFPPGSILAPGTHLAVVRHPTAFTLRHGTGLTAVGPYAGALDNDGDTLLLLGADGRELVRFRYRDTWSSAADGGGHSLVLRYPAAPRPDYSQPASWALSGTPHGSPGTANGPIFSHEFGLWRAAVFSEADLADPLRSGAEADPDGDGASTWLEYTMATNPLNASSRPHAAAHLEGTSVLFRFTRARGVLDATFIVESSSDGTRWAPAATPPERTTATDTAESMQSTLPRTDEPRQFLRLRVSKNF